MKNYIYLTRKGCCLFTFLFASLLGVQIINAAQRQHPAPERMENQIDSQRQAQKRASRRSRKQEINGSPMSDTVLSASGGFLAAGTSFGLGWPLTVAIVIGFIFFVINRRVLGLLKQNSEPK